MLQHMLEGAHDEFGVVVGDGLQRVVADAGVQAAHEEHGLGHDLVQLHRVVPGTAGHAEDGQAQGLHRSLPARLPRGVAGRGGGAQGFLERVANAAPLRIRDEIQSRFYIGSVGDMNIYVMGSDGIEIPAGGTIYNGIFNRDAIALDVRRALAIEPERDASLRRTELNATMVYAAGVWRKNWGVAIKALAETPS